MLDASYVHMRQAALALSPKLLGLPDSWQGPFGVLMEVHSGATICTLVATSDGVVNLYYANGGGVLGMGQRSEAVRTAGRELIAASAKLAAQFTPSFDHPPPAPGSARFFVLTLNGVGTAQADEEQLSRRESPLWPLFALSHHLIAAVRDAMAESKP